MFYMITLFGCFRAASGLSEELEVRASSPEAKPGLRTIALRKQYVPVIKEGKTVAYKTAYFGKVQAGTPAQSFTVVFDTGSGHFILPHIACQSSTCAKHNRYDLSKSVSALEIEHDGTPVKSDKERDQVVVSFGTGKVTGEFVHDLVCVGDAPADCVKLRMVLATEMTEDPFGLFEFDGVMGLGLDALRLHSDFSFFGEMLKQNPALSPQFSVFLSRHDGGSSWISFGGYDEKLATSDIQWAPVAMAELGHWVVQIKQVRVGDTVLDECTDGTCRAVVDTGTSLLGVPRPGLRSMHKLLARLAPTGVDPNEIDCRQVPGHPIEFDLGDVTVSLPVEDYARPSPINMTSPDSNKSSMVCRSLLLPIDMKEPLGPKVFIWGEPILRRYLTVFDLGEKRVGFSPARELDPPVEKLGVIGAPPAGSLLAGAPLQPLQSTRGQKA